MGACYKNARAANRGTEISAKQHNFGQFRQKSDEILK